MEDNKEISLQSSGLTELSTSFSTLTSPYATQSSLDQFKPSHDEGNTNSQSNNTEEDKSLSTITNKNMNDTQEQDVNVEEKDKVQTSETKEEIDIKEIDPSTLENSTAEPAQTNKEQNQQAVEESQKKNEQDAKIEQTDHKETKEESNETDDNQPQLTKSRQDFIHSVVATLGNDAQSPPTSPILPRNHEHVKESKMEVDENNNQETKKKRHSQRHKKEHKEPARQLRFEATKVDELPKDLKKLVKETKIPTAELDEHFQVVLNILHFLTKKVYITEAELKALRNANSNDKQSEDKKDEQKKGGFRSFFNTFLSRDKKDKEATKVEKKQEEKKIEDKNQVKNKDEDNDKKQNKESSLPRIERSDSNYKVPSDKTPSREDDIEFNEDDNETEDQPEERPQPQMSLPNNEKQSTEPEATDDVPVRKVSSAEVLERRSSKLDMSVELYFIKQNPKNQFKNLRKAGKGGYGSVFTAKDNTENKMVAIKKMKHSNHKERLQNYNEVRLLKKCDHPNIVKYNSCYEFNNECWLVMEYMEGGTLTDARRGHEFEENEVAYVARELLRALAYIHSIGLVHRDVKSSNIMMTIMGDIKLIDFGLCSEHKKIKPTMLGSPHWMPPEMILRKQHSYTADIWSFGISLLELANKHPPTVQNKIKAMFIAAVGTIEPFEEPNKWSDNFKHFMSRCLEKDPTKRASAEELLKHPFLEQAANTRKVMRKILTEVFVQRAIGLF